MEQRERVMFVEKFFEVGGGMSMDTLVSEFVVVRDKL